jgi:hypothetical protein
MLVTDIQMDAQSNGGRSYIPSLKETRLYKKEDMNATTRVESVTIEQEDGTRRHREKYTTGSAMNSVEAASIA